VLTRAAAVLLAMLMLGTCLPSLPAAASGCSGTRGFTSPDGWLVCASATAIGQRRPGPVGTAPVTAVASATEPSSAATTQTVCTYGNTDTVDGTAPPSPRVGARRWMFVYCGDSGQPGGWLWVPAAAAVVFASPTQLARQAYARLTPPAAVPDYNPRRRAGSPDGTVVGFTTWLWLDGQSLSAKSVTASAGPNRATVTARPSLVSFDPGDGSAAVVCAGGGKAWDSAEPNAVSNCVHRYLKASEAASGGVFVLTARVTWTATWVGSGGTGGVLPALTVAAATPVRVDELQAVNE
jgi:hypothetical protein